MNKQNKLALNFLFLSFTFFIYSCSGGTASSSFGLPSTSILPTDGVAGSDDGITDSSQFYVGVNSEVNTIAHVHVSGDFTKACSILPTEQSKDLTCIIEIPEAELYFQGMSMKYNVPAGMCRYFERYPYYYYNKEIGQGPTNIEIYKVTSSDGTTILSQSMSVDSTEFSVTNTSSHTFAEVTIDTSSSPPKLTCVYDTSGSSGSNCCFGKYTYSLREVKYTSDTEFNDSGVVSSLVDWGGNYSSCIAGAAKEWPQSSQNGLPKILNIFAKKGLYDQTYTLSPPYSLDKLNNRHIANYYKTSIHGHTGFGPSLTVPIAARTSTKPYFIDPIDDRNGSKFPSATSDTYTYTCTDEAHEVLHNVSVYVREWDTYQDYVNYIQSSGVTELPDRGSGIEGVNCAGILSGPCNDFYDHDDFVTLERNVSSGYATTSSDITSRSSYFPND